MRSILMADPEFPNGMPTPNGGGGQPNIRPNLTKNYMEMKKIMAGGEICLCRSAIF